MSITLMSLVWDRAPYDGGALLILLALADWANEEGITWPSMAQLAGKARMQIRNARYILRKLEDDQCITRESTGSGRATTVYRLNIEALQALPLAWKRPQHAQPEQLGNKKILASENAPQQNLHEAPHCRPGGHPIAALGGNDCRPGGHPIAALGGTPLPPIRHRSVREPSEDPPTPAERGWEGSAYLGWEGTKSGTPRELGTNPRAMQTNPREVAKQAAQDTIAACTVCDVRGQVELRREDDTVVMLRCPHDLDTLRAVMSAHGYFWSYMPPDTPTAAREGAEHVPW